MSDVIKASLILLIGLPIAGAVYFGFAFLRQAHRAARLRRRAAKERPNV